MKKAIQIGAWTGLITLFAMTAIPCPAADSAVLRNGFSIRHERRQVIGTVTRLYVGKDDSSFVDIPTAEIDHFEALADEPASHLRFQTASVQAASVQAASVQAASDSLNHQVDLNQVVETASGTYRLDPDLVNSVIHAESGFNVRAVSPKGAQGLMQLMPQTASELGVQNAFDPRANVEGGTRYLRELLERYDFDLIKALAAYNAGPERVEQYGGVPPYYETKAYVARIVREFNKKKLAAKAATAPAAQKSTAKKSTGTRTQTTKLQSSKAQLQAKTNPTQSSE
ncbi:MAG TPA: lytic transglycosylase domain-containing protein [Candidatus Eremiobacteraceae bacterium]|nr:lytic transglycosylase domain-containing protein [Candidatus Eremiobacteraceae bacterium]